MAAPRLFPGAAFSAKTAEFYRTCYLSDRNRRLFGLQKTVSATQKTALYTAKDRLLKTERYHFENKDNNDGTKKRHAHTGHASLFLFNKKMY